MIHLPRPWWSSLRPGVAGLGILLAGCGGGSVGNDGSRSEQVRTTPDEAIVKVEEITRERPFVNSLGMKLVPLADTGDQICIWETRVQDFVACLKATGQPVPVIPAGRMLHPAAGVSWNDAMAFCAWLTEKEQKEGRIGPRDRYRLPKDKEWSMAAGGTRYIWGDNWPKTEERVALPGYKPSDGEHTAPVGSYPPNEMGLHDLSGNVFEWCLDWYSMDMNPPELRLEFERLTFDGKGSAFRVLRGASWVFFDSLNLVSGYRYFNKPESRGILYGFRVLLDRNALGQGQPPPDKLPPWIPPFADAQSITGREAYRANCVECHQYYDPVLYPAEDWDRWLGRMRGKAKLNDKDFNAVSQFTHQLRRSEGGESGAVASR